MKLKFTFSVVLIALAVSVFAQSPLDSINWKQFSIGYNALRPLSHGESGFEVPMLFMKYRTNSHAFSMSLSTGTVNKDYSNAFDGFPGYINGTDSTLIIRYNSTFKTGGSFSINYEKYQNLEHNRNVEFYVGAGLTFGTNQSRVGYNYITYQKDTTGALILNDSLTKIYYPGIKGNYKIYRVGVVPYGGFLFMPDKVFSLGFEARAPFVYESKTPLLSTEAPSNGVYFNLFFSVNLILNFDLNFVHTDF
ncbi:MAG: hypothetical protein WCI97_12600 [Bacteroidota bacterium]